MRNLLWWFGVAACALAVWFFAAKLEDAQPASVFAPGLRKGDRVYVLTGQWHRKFTNLSSRGSGRTITDLLVDVWAFDANTANPVWRKRLYKERGGAMHGWRLFGADGDALWVFGKDGLRAVSLTDGRVLANAEALEGQNAGLRGLLPTEERYFQFDSQGLHFRAADGRDWWLDANLSAHQSAPTGTRDLTPTSYFTPSSGVSFRDRGLLIGDRWIGLLNEDEAKMFEQHGAIGGLEYQSRRRLWSARTTQGTNFFGKVLKYHDFKPMGPEFLGPGLIAENMPTGPDRVIWSRNPDSLFVLHRDRLGEAGKLRLSRIAGPEGRALWEAHLRMSMLQSVIPGKQSLVLLGVEYQPAPDASPRDPMHGSSPMLISIDLQTGRVFTFDFSFVDPNISSK